jgi:hypothetical protein
MATIVAMKKSHTLGTFALLQLTDMSLSNKQQNAISIVAVVQTLTLKTTKEFEFGSFFVCLLNALFGSLHKDLNSFEPVEYVRQI